MLSSNFTPGQDSGDSSSLGTITDFEFSSNSSNVYLLNYGVYVKNYTSGSPSLRQLTKSTDSTFPNGFKNMTRDKYGNILISSISSGYIQQIENQNSFSASSIKMDYIDLHGNGFLDNYYLPQLIPELPTCTPSLIITSNVTTGVDKKLASVSIQASNTISNGAGIIYHAPTVVLKPQFAALVGSTAHIYPIGCTGTFLAKKASVTSTTKNINNTEFKTPAEFITIFPNPSNGVFKISLNEITNGTIVVTDINGRTVYQSDFKNQSEFDMNLQHQSKGVYIVKVVSGNKNEVKKIIIQ